MERGAKQVLATSPEKLIFLEVAENLKRPVAILPTHTRL